jgi:hypothetical protein
MAHDPRLHRLCVDATGRGWMVLWSHAHPPSARRFEILDSSGRLLSHDVGLTLDELETFLTGDEEEVAFLRRQGALSSAPAPLRTQD